MNAPHTLPLRRPRLVLLSLLLGLLPVAVHANSRTDAGPQTWTAHRSLVTPDNGLVYSLPVIDRGQLASEVNSLNIQLKQRQEDLNETIEKNGFSTTDALIVAALPGGLIYAAVKRQRTRQAEKELERINSQLDSLAGFVARKKYASRMLAAR